MEQKLLSVIVPCFNEEESIPIFYQEIIKVADQMKHSVQFEILFVDDGSRDGTLRAARQLSREDSV